MSKQDGYASRTPADLERKYKFGETFAEVFGLVTDARKIAEEAQSAIEGLDQEAIFNLLTNNGKAQGVYRDDNGDVYVNASYIKSGKLAAQYIDAENLKVSAANITGTLTIGQLPGTVAKTGDIPTKTSQLTNNSGFVDSNAVTTITNNAIKTAEISANQITAGKFTGISLETEVDPTYGNVYLYKQCIQFAGAMPNLNAIIENSYDTYYGCGKLDIRADVIELDTSFGHGVKITTPNGYWTFNDNAIFFVNTANEAVKEAVLREF